MFCEYYSCNYEVRSQNSFFCCVFKFCEFVRITLIQKFGNFISFNIMRLAHFPLFLNGNFHAFCDPRLEHKFRLSLRERNLKGVCLSTTLLKMSTNSANSEIKLFTVISGRNVIKLVQDFSRSSLKASEENLVISLFLLWFYSKDVCYLFRSICAKLRK